MNSQDKKCPFCSGLVQRGAIRCEHCHEWITVGTCLSCLKRNRVEAKFCGYCGHDILIGPNNSASTDTSGMTSKNLFERAMYKECQEFSQNILREIPNNSSAQFYLGLSMLFNNPDDHYFIDQGLYYLLVDSATPVGRLATIIGYINSSLQQEPALKSALAAHVLFYYQSRMIPKSFPLTYSISVLEALKRFDLK